MVALLDLINQILEVNFVCVCFMSLSNNQFILINVQIIV